MRLGAAHYSGVSEDVEPRVPCLTPAILRPIKTVISVQLNMRWLEILILWERDRDVYIGRQI
jgi:hypothetical protein